MIGLSLRDRELSNTPKLGCSEGNAVQPSESAREGGSLKSVPQYVTFPYNNISEDTMKWNRGELTKSVEALLIPYS